MTSRENFHELGIRVQVEAKKHGYVNVHIEELRKSSTKNAIMVALIGVKDNGDEEALITVIGTTKSGAKRIALDKYLLKMKGNK